MSKVRRNFDLYHILKLMMSQEKDLQLLIN